MDTCIDYDRAQASKILEERRLKKVNNRGADLGLKNDRARQIALLASRLYNEPKLYIEPKPVISTRLYTREIAKIPEKVPTPLPKKKRVTKRRVVKKQMVIKKKKKIPWYKRLFACGGASFVEEEEIVEVMEEVKMKRRYTRKTPVQAPVEPLVRQPIHRETMKNMRYEIMLNNMNLNK